MQSVGRTFSTDFKAKVALAALKGDKSLLELEKEFVVPMEQIAEWKQQLLDNISRVFEEGNSQDIAASLNATAKNNHAKIGELIAQNDFLTKVLGR